MTAQGDKFQNKKSYIKDEEKTKSSSPVSSPSASDAFQPFSVKNFNLCDCAALFSATITSHSPFKIQAYSQTGATSIESVL